MGAKKKDYITPARNDSNLPIKAKVLGKGGKTQKKRISLYLGGHMKCAGLERGKGEGKGLTRGGLCLGGKRVKKGEAGNKVKSECGIVKGGKFKTSTWERGVRKSCLERKKKSESQIHYRESHKADPSVIH